MDPIENMIPPFLISYIYVEYTVAVVIMTELLKRAVSEMDYHPKWIGGAVALVLAGIGIFLKLIVFHTQVEFFKLVTSFGVSVLAYDYLIKPIKDKLLSK
jgi:hypothetical protein